MRNHHLNALLAVAETGTVRGAARELNLSQAALTKSLKELEAEVEAPLLIRSYRGVQLTAAGKILRDRATVARRQLQMALTEIRNLDGGSAGRVSVGVTPMAILSVLPAVSTHMRRVYPDAHLTLQEGLPSIVVPALVAGSLDFAVVMAVPERLPDAVVFEPLARIAFCAVARQGHPLRKQATLAELRECEWIFSMHGGSYSERLLIWMAEQGHAAPARILDCNSMLINWQLLLSSDMVTMLPMSFFQAPSVGAEARGLMQFDIRLPDAVVGLISLKHAPLSETASVLADLFRHYLRGSLEP